MGSLGTQMPGNSKACHASRKWRHCLPRQPCRYAAMRWRYSASWALSRW